MPLIVNVCDAKNHFSRLLEQAHAGQEIVLAKVGKPYARLMPLAADTGARQPGRLAGRIGADFFEPLPENELETKLVPIDTRSGVRIGVAKGVFEVPANIDVHNDEVAHLFVDLLPLGRSSD
jgi:prevent-host-death family protein